MFHTHPDTIRPDFGGFFLPTGPSFEPESPDIARRMATVILRQAADGQATELHHFREAEETRGLTPAELRAHLGKAKQIADRTVIRQNDPTYRSPQQAGEVLGVREATAEDDLSEATDDQLLEIASDACAPLVSDADIVNALLHRGMRPAAISRIWPRLTVRLAARVAQLTKPTIGAIARVAREG